MNATTDPGSEAIVCGAPSWFIQVTVVPVFIVSVAGLNSKFLIMTEFNPAPGVRVAGVVVCGLCEDMQPENAQVRTSRITHADPNRTLV